MLCRTEGDSVGFTGLSEHRHRPDESVMRPATIITTDSREDLDEISNRMPMILEPDTWVH